MSAYRFCRTDDIPLLVDALNRCWTPHFPAEPEMTVARFKREIRDHQVWCSSCMVAFAGADPIAVLIGAKRSGTTLVQRIAVHPDHLRHGHGRHLLTSLSSKLAILGPPAIVAEVPGTARAGHDLFAACGFVHDACYTDFVLDRSGAGGALPHVAAAREVVPEVTPNAAASAPALFGRFVIPVTIDDLAANGLLCESDPRFCWERSLETLTARKDEISGRAIATEEGIEAYVLYTDVERDCSPGAAGGGGTEILALRSHVADDDGVRLRLLLENLIAANGGPVRMNKVHSEEVPGYLLTDRGFRCREVHARHAATAKPA